MLVSDPAGGKTSGWSSIASGPPAAGPAHGVPNTTHMDTFAGSTPVANANPLSVGV